MLSYLIRNAVSCLWSIPRLCIIKLFAGRRFSFRILERLSPNTDILLLHGGSIRIGRKMRMHHGSALNADGGSIEIGDDVRLSTNVTITAHERIVIGDHTGIASGTLIYDHDHDYREKGGYSNAKFRTRPVIIGKNVWIGANCIILRGTTIGDDCVIGAGTVVKGDIPAHSLVYPERSNIIRRIEP